MSAEEHTELQRQAAKAMGFKVSVKRADGGLFVTSSSRRIPFKWNPEHDDGDSRRLEVALGISVEHFPYNRLEKHSVITKQRRPGDMMRQQNLTQFAEAYGDDPAAATRLSVLRTAAAIGREKNPPT